MKLAVLCLCMLHLALVSSRLFARNDLQAAESSLSLGKAQAPRSTGSLNKGRVRPLFARRGQYERQRIHVPRPRVVPVAPKNIAPPAKVTPDPVISNCSQLTQSCFPQSGCCDPCATCHCHFFNTICFCWRVNSQCNKKA
ncbi:agouti-signaling protein-like [Embiotoca jacksoni]|uniref:agouti-signaling protein-like n=1 Tax=Embiotoca jacksoni TaxID=100190 RepID=UPI0037044E58